MNRAEQVIDRLYAMSRMVDGLSISDQVHADLIALAQAAEQSTSLRRQLDRSGARSRAVATEFATIGAAPAAAVDRDLAVIRQQQVTASTGITEIATRSSAFHKPGGRQS